LRVRLRVYKRVEHLIGAPLAILTIIILNWKDLPRTNNLFHYIHS
jgi:hypothetical protein